jgi:hypothetical protein
MRRKKEEERRKKKEEEEEEEKEGREQFHALIFCVGLGQQADDGLERYC